LGKQPPRTGAQHISQWIIDIVGLTKADNIDSLVHGVSLSVRGSGRLDTRLDTPPSNHRRHPVSVIAPGMTVRELMREKGTPAAELGLLDEGTKDAAIIDAMLTYPILVNRPIVATPLGVKLCRPSEVVLTLLDQRPERFTKEDGEVVEL
jgi:hypothetical protein